MRNPVRIRLRVRLWTGVYSNRTWNGQGLLPDLRLNMKSRTQCRMKLAPKLHAERHLLNPNTLAWSSLGSINAGIVGGECFVRAVHVGVRMPCSFDCVIVMHVDERLYLLPIFFGAGALLSIRCARNSWVFLVRIPSWLTTLVVHPWPLFLFAPA